jgi:predicted RecB family nuclease
MFAQSERVILSATDLNNYLGCRHATFLDLADLGRPRSAVEPDPHLELLQKKGLEHEQKHLASLKEQGRRIAEIDRYSTIDQRIAQTHAAMAEGVDVIYQGALLDAPWMGYADFLVRVDGRTRLGNCAYEVVDTKLARTAQPKHVIQLCVYSRLLGVAQGQLPGNVHLVMGDSTQVSWPLSYFLHYADLAQRRVVAFVAAPPRQSFGEPCAHCGYCPWLGHCTGEWERIDHLSLVANISRSQIAKLKAAGIDSVRKLSDLTGGATVPSLQRETLARLRQQARLQVSKRDTGADRHELLEPLPGKGFARMPKPDKGDLFFDMEGDPLADGGLEYLFGFAFTESGESRFKAFWAHTRAEEKRAFEAAVDFIFRRLADHPDAHIYHYANYEESALKRLSVLHGTREGEIDSLLWRHKLVDLYKVVREAIRVSEPRTSIKNLETFYMGKREGDVGSGGESIVVYEQWRELGDPALLREIEDYNATDCRSTLLLRDWLLTLRPQATPWFTEPAPQADDAKREEARTQAEERLRSITGRLLENVRRKTGPVASWCRSCSSFIAARRSRSGGRRSTGRSSRRRSSSTTPSASAGCGRTLPDRPCPSSARSLTPSGFRRRTTSSGSAMTRFARTRAKEPAKSSLSTMSGSRCRSRSETRRRRFRKHSHCFQPDQSERRCCATRSIAMPRP